MKRQILAMASGFEQYAKKTRRALFLEEMEQVVPRAQLCRLIEPHYPQAGNGRPPVGGGADAASLLSAAMVQPVGSGVGRGAVRLGNDAAICRHRSGAGAGVRRDQGVQVPSPAGRARPGEILQTVNVYLQSRGVRITTGTIVDATIIHAPSSTNNRERKCDPAMHQTRKGETLVLRDEGARGGG